MKKLLSLALIIVTLVTINSCKKNEITSIPDPIVPFEAGKSITTIVAGKVTAQDGTALNNVEITIGTATTITDAGGNFIIPKATLGEKVGFIKATKAGYFAGSRTIMPKEKVVNNVIIQLVKKTESGNFANASGGTITVATGGKIEFPANAVATKSGAAYTGTVKVSAYFLDPTSASCNKEMPGDLRGINTGNNEQVLTSYGMMAVELNGSNGEALQLATGKNATLTFPLVSSIFNTAPATIPLWFFDETKGMWVEQGVATKTGNNYVGTVSHFTWWNCDVGIPLINLTFKLVDEHGSPIANAYVVLTRNVSISTWSWGNSACGTTASDGSITGAVPYNETFKMNVFLNSQCTNTTPNFKTTIGPFTQSTNLGTITATIANLTQQTTTIKGTVVDCNNNPVANGYAIIHFGNEIFYDQITNGAFSKMHTYCTTTPTGTATIDVFDLATLKQNLTPATVNITGAGTFNVGQIQACGVQNFVHYKATFVDQNGVIPNNNTYVTFTTDSIGYSYPQNGVINAIIPANKIVTRKVYINTFCNGYILADSTLIGPFSSDFNAGIITINIPQPTAITISGTVKDCSNNNVTNGTATITIDGSSYNTTITNGNFSQQITRCKNTATTATINVTDNLNHQQNTTPIAVSVTNVSVNIGSVQACGLNINEYLTYSFNGNNYSADSTTTYTNVTNTYLIGNSFGTNYTYFSAFFSGNTIGSYSGSYIDIQVNNKRYSTVPLYGGNINVTEYGSAGQYVAGNFSANLADTVNGVPKTYPLTGTFRMKRR